jgi:hypothetical protein
MARRRPARGYAQLEWRAEPIGRHRKLPAALARVIDQWLEPGAAQRPSIATLTTMIRRPPGTPDLRRATA